MATFPAKTNYAAGNVLTAAQMVDIGEQINALNGNAGKNKIINGDFNINQRSFSSSAADNSYCFDRWKIYSSAASLTYSAQTFTPGTAPVAGYESTNFIRLATAGQNTTTGYSLMVQHIEDVRTFANQTATISFWAKATSGTPKIAVAVNQNFGSGGSPSASTQNYIGQVTLSTSWVRYSLTVAVPTIAGKTIGTTANTSNLELEMWASAGSNYNARTGSLGVQNNTIDIWGVQMEAGNVATAFQTATGTLAGELVACERYFQLIASGNGKAIMNGTFYSATSWYGIYNTRVTMRTAPTISQTTGTDYYRVFTGNSAIDPFDAISAVDQATGNAARFQVTSGISQTTGYAGWIETNNASAFVALQAEL